jgi:DNA polymerase I-like protein with 3'-5' exonuclease and polymerase domains
MTNIMPSDFLAWFADYDGNAGDSVSWDTETSGLFADDGARVSTASIAFEVIDPDAIDSWIVAGTKYDNLTVGWEDIAPEYQAFLVSTAWPFDQGTEGKPEDTGQGMLWPEAENLPESEWVALLDLLAANELDAHNAKFDLEKMRVGVRRWPGVGRDLQDNVVWDTQNVNSLLWGLEPTSLKPTCARIFGKQWADEAGVVKKYLQKSKLPAGRWDLIPWEVISQYADTDARITKMLKLRQIWEIENNGAGSWIGDPAAVMEKVQRRLDVMKVLYRMEMRGLPYDEVTSMEAGFECRKRAEVVAEALPFTPNEAKKFYFGEGKTSKGVECLDMVPYSVTDKGAPQLTAEIVGRMVEDRVPHAAKYDEWRRCTTAASMWYNGYADAMGRDGRLRTCFRQNGTRSSRFSVERVNLQAIPQDYRLSDHNALAGIPTPRQIIAKAVADLGWKIYELDLAQAELRVATMFAKCQTMYDMIVNGEDLHTFTTKALFPQVDPEDPLFKSKWRQVGKRGNFSLQFGSGAKTFRAMVSKETGIILGESESERIVKEWNGLYPEFGRAIRKHMDVVQKRQNKFGYGWVDFVNGERRWFQPYEEAHKAFNQRVQGNLGQFGINWMLKSDEYLRSQGLDDTPIGGAGLILTIHDSQVLLLPQGPEGEAMAAQCAQFGKDLWKEMFPGIVGDVDYHDWTYEAA